MVSDYVLAIDPGATNVKGILRHQAPGGQILPEIVASYSTPSRVEINALGIACEQVPLFELIGQVPHEQRTGLGAIVITSHGATQIPIDEAGEPVFGVVSYDNACFDRTHDACLEEFGGSAALYQETGSAEYGKGINALQQLYYFRHTFPEKFATVTHFLPLSSYLAFQLTGERYTCHTHTRNHAYLEAVESSPDSWRWSDAVYRMGLTDRFPPFKQPYEIYGTILTQIAHRFDLPLDCVVIAAGHDTSIASILAPNYINTGTWICNTAAGVSVDRTPEMQNKGIVVNADVYGHHLRTLMARLGQTRDAYRAQYGGELPQDVAFNGFESLSEDVVPLAFTEGVGVYPSRMEAVLPGSFLGEVEAFLHSLSFTLVVPEVLSSIFTSDPAVTLDRTLARLLAEGYKAKDVVIGGNFVNDLSDGQIGTFTGFFVRAYPGKVERFAFPEPTSYAAHILAVCAREGLTPSQLGNRLHAPKENITHHNDRSEMVREVERWEACQRALLQD